MSATVLPGSDRPAAATTVAAVLRAAHERLAAAGLATARQDAEALLGRALRTTRLALYTEGRAPVPAAADRAFEALVIRRAGHEPLQYLLGEAEFCGLAVAVGPGTFIPRPETEELVDRAAARGPAGVATVVEPCTGSGAIACALAARRTAWDVWAVEAAPRALACARANVERLGFAGRVRVLDGDLFAPLALHLPARGADLVVVNPPYLETAALPSLPVEVRDWEPRAALDGGADGLTVVRRVLHEAPAWLRSGGWLLVEIGETQGPAVTRLVAADRRYAEATLSRDFRGRVRFVEARRR
jgi:release factor glutamine methyltransferase